MLGLLALTTTLALVRHIKKSQKRHERLSPTPTTRKGTIVSNPTMTTQATKESSIIIGGGGKTSPSSILKIPTPVFVTSLPKSGTTSTWKYFSCGLGKGQAAHQIVNVENNTKQVKLGNCLNDNISSKKQDFLDGCGDYQVWTDAGVIAPGTCFYPSIHGGLQALYDSYPLATIVQVNRETEAWVNSTTEFNDLWPRWINQKCEKFPGVGSTPHDYGKFYEWHTEMVRDFAKNHPSMTYIEVSLEGSSTGQILEEATGINASCWIHSKTKKGKRGRPQHQKQKELDNQQQTNKGR